MVTTILEVLGLALIASGLAIAYAPAGLVAAGVGLLLISRGLTRA